MGNISICLCCMSDLTLIQEPFMVNFRYQVPGEGKPEVIVIAEVCDKCAKESDDPSKFPALECIILCRVIRLEHEEKLFTPQKRADE